MTQMDAKVDSCAKMKSRLLETEAEIKKVCECNAQHIVVDVSGILSPDMIGKLTCF